MWRGMDSIDWDWWQSEDYWFCFGADKPQDGFRAGMLSLEGKIIEGRSDSSRGWDSPVLNYACGEMNREYFKTIKVT